MDKTRKSAPARTGFRRSNLALAAANPFPQRCAPQRAAWPFSPPARQRQTAPFSTAALTQFAESKGYEVEAVFPDTITGGGDFMKRPGMVAMLSYMDAQPDEDFAVIFDDLKRASRDTRAFLDLRDAFRSRNALVECLNFKFDDSPEGEFIETIIAAQGALERKQNGRQVTQKMRVRASLGYWTHLNPPGYRFATVKGHGRLMVRDEPLASLIQEALEGFASGRFQTQAEVRRFLQDQPLYPRGPSGRVGPEKVSKMLKQPLYAGYINSEAFGLSWVKAQHEPLISLDTYQKIQERIAGTAQAPKRANIGDHFTLRGIAICACCEAPLRSSFSTGRNGKRHPYYLCQTKGCEAYGKSIKRDVLEDEVGALIRQLEPAPALVNLAKAMFRKAWADREVQAKESAVILKRQVADVNRQIEKMLSRLMDANSETVIRTYEKKVEQLERDKAILAEKAANPAKPRGSFEDHLEPVLAFLASPWKIWETGEITLGRLILKLCFADRIKCCRNEGPRTPEIALPFKALGGLEISSVGSGGPEGTNLEPSEYLGLLSELETWSELLKAEPEVIHRLAVLADEEDGVADQPADDVVPVVPPSWEPSP